MDGFYIGRYEVGDGDATSRNESSGINHIAVEQQGRYVYNYISWYDAYDICKKFSSTKESVNSCLMYGCLWDATLEYLVESGNKTYVEIVDSTGWGNYYNATFSYVDILGLTKEKKSSTDGTSSSRVLIPTGSTEYTKVCNIYDLAGNVWEWTEEAYHSTGSNRNRRRR